MLVQEMTEGKVSFFRWCRVHLKEHVST